MANLTPAISNDNVYQLEITDYALGGAGQVMNSQAQALLNRLAYETNRATTAEGLLAPISSPTLTGTPAAPTASPGNNTTQIATTAYVIAALTSYAPLSSPSFTGSPVAPTPAFANNSTLIATTAFVQEATSISAMNTQSGTTYTLVLTDAGNSVELTNASPVTVTVPPHSSVAFNQGVGIDIIQGGAGKVTLAPGAGVTIYSLAGNLSVSGQYAGVTLRQTGTADTWYLLGSLIA